MTELFITGSLELGIFMFVIYMLTKSAASIHLSKFIVLILSLPVLLILLHAFLLKSSPGVEEDKFIELAKIILTLIQDTIRLIIERKTN
jgi:hypothetical protein